MTTTHAQTHVDLEVLHLMFSARGTQAEQNGRGGGSGELRDGNRLRAVRRCGTDH